MGHKQRLRAGRREAMQMDDDPAEDPDAIHIEVDSFGVPIGDETRPATKAATVEPDEDEPLEVLKRQFQELETERNHERQRAADLEARNREHEATIAQRAGSELANQKAVLEQAYRTEE